MLESRQWAVVLGVSSGAGAAIARRVARSPGLDVFGVHRGNHGEEAAAVARDVAAEGRRVHLRIADAGTEGAATEGAEELFGVAGGQSVKLLVHSLACASVGQLASGDASQLRASQLHRTFDAMAHSFVYWVQALLARGLLAPQARIIGLSNPIVDTVVRGTAAIAATKAALEIYCRHLAHELGRQGHRVNLVKFGAVVTPAVERTFGERGVARLRAALGRAIPAGRLGTMEDVAALVSLLAGDELSWFNGATIDFTGAEGQGMMDALLFPDPVGSPRR